MDPDIAPLAQRLAEENNVDWRSLEGTGENGRIVERDVLDYLARVMAGEEAIDPTPEPLPEGMQAWVDDEGRPIDAPGTESGADDADDGAVELAADEADAPSGDEEDLLLAGDDLLVGADASATSAEHEARTPPRPPPSTRRRPATTSRSRTTSSQAPAGGPICSRTTTPVAAAATRYPSCSRPT